MASVHPLRTFFTHMLVIRLNRYGKRNQAQFRLILQEKTKAPGHRHVEVLGSHNPHSKDTLLKKERILYWISQGAEPSDRVHNMLVKAGVIEGKIIPKKMKRPERKEAAIVEVQVPEAPATPEATLTEAPAEAEAEAVKA